MLLPDDAGPGSARRQGAHGPPRPTGSGLLRALPELAAEAGRNARSCRAALLSSESNKEEAHKLAEDFYRQEVLRPIRQVSAGREQDRNGPYDEGRRYAAPACWPSSSWSLLFSRPPALAVRAPKTRKMRKKTAMRRLPPARAPSTRKPSAAPISPNSITCAARNWIFTISTKPPSKTCRCRSTSIRNRRPSFGSAIPIDPKVT